MAAMKLDLKAANNKIEPTKMYSRSYSVMICGLPPATCPTATAGISTTDVVTFPLLATVPLLGDRAFLVAATRECNSLPSTVTAALTLHSFHRALTTHLFTASFPPS